MPKSILIEPEKVFASETLRLSSIPVNAYTKTVADERAEYSPVDFLHIWQDMCGIREFETILNEIKPRDRTRVLPTIMPARRTFRSGRKPPPSAWLLAHATRPDLRLASQPRRNPGQGILRDPPVE
jgi:hypothetical protein